MPSKMLNEMGNVMRNEMPNEEATASEVKSANRQLYDAIADRYEDVDGRRSPELETWLKQTLARLRHDAPGGCLLDIGTGSGLTTRCAEGIFDWRVGVDLSPRILAASAPAFSCAAAADVDHLPFVDSSFDVITGFAVLHHLFDFSPLAAEVARVLKPGGIFYSDHDMDAAFSRRFRLPLSLYRRLHDAEARYRHASAVITSELYALSEWQAGGVDSRTVVRQFHQAGLSAHCQFHWYGLASPTDRLFGKRHYPRGWAPLLSLIAVK